jgi:hypothetical protein
LPTRVVYNYKEELREYFSLLSLLTSKLLRGTLKSRSDPYCPIGVPFRLILTVRSS